MGFDLTALRAAIEAHGPVARVVVADLRGSTPREPGAAMLVWADGQQGTIGGGALEYQAAGAARDMLARGGSALRRVALGPDMGQCCGGSVTLVTEAFCTTADLPDLPAQAMAHARPIGAATADKPLAVARLLDRARAMGSAPEVQMIDGWLIEPVARARHDLWVWGAGHVGRAIVATLAPLPDLALTWVDTAPDRFPDTIPDGVTALPAARPELLMPHAPQDAHHLILTYSHDLDLALCSAALTHGFASAGLIGSATKWARFRKRLAAMGHAPAQIAGICCPIGQPALGKHPQAIAIGVAWDVMQRMGRQDPAERTATG